MNALEVLLEEHEIILRAIDALSQSVSQLEKGKQVPNAFYWDTLDLLRNFADRCHHGKEETSLFPLITQKEPQQTGVIRSLLGEHANGRKYIQALKTAVEQQNTTEKISNTQRYVNLLTEHIEKENAVFPLWFTALNSKEQDYLFENFERIEAEVIGLGKHHEYIERVEQLQNRLKEDQDTAA